MLSGCLLKMVEGAKGSRKDEGTGSPTETPEGMQPCQQLGFRPVAPFQTSNLCNSETINLCCFKTLSLWEFSLASIRNELCG